jgi:predicted O-methyltransferase YrrM
MELAQEYANKYPEMIIYLEDLKSIITQYISSDVFEGNCFYYHNSLQEFSELYTKQLNLFWCGKQATRICEIGFNAGHSSMLLLLGRNQDPLQLTVFDIGQHRYTAPCFDYIKQSFSHVQFEYVEGDSTIAMPEWINANSERKSTYDLVHVDGGHSEYCASNDMKNADILLKIDGIMVIDDTDAPLINNQVDIYVASGRYVELNVLKTFGYPHRIIRKVSYIL